MDPAPDGDVTPIRVPASLLITLGATAALVVLIGVFPSLVLHVSDLTSLVASAAERRSLTAVRLRSAARIRRHGPLPFDEVIERALYDPSDGFYASGGRAGPRRGDFITSPEVGPLFGAVVARAFDEWWRELGDARPVRRGRRRRRHRHAGPRGAARPSPTARRR